MRRYSAQYIFTNAGPALKRGIVTAGEDGVIASVEDTGGDLNEQASVEFHNGIIIPGFVNCHSHLELSHLKGSVPAGSGLAEFIRSVRLSREHCYPGISHSVSSASHEMFSEGIVLCADICNSSATFDHKKTSRIKYINLLEVFGINPERAGRRMEEISAVAKAADEAGLEWWLVPHSAYSVSLSLFSLLKKKSLANKITSMHFMESEGEKLFLSDHSGPVRTSYDESGLTAAGMETPFSHSAAVLEEVTPSGNLILVHNTYTDTDTIRVLKERKNLYWCLCPNSNIHIERKIPPLSLLKQEGCTIVIGTDSFASNSRLSILEELKTLQTYFPEIPLEDLIRFGTLNGALALGREETFGKIEPGTKPGLLLLRDIDLHEMKLLPGSNVQRVL